MKAIILTDKGEPIGIVPVKDLDRQEYDNIRKICDANQRKSVEELEKEAQEKEKRLQAIERALAKLNKGVNMALGLDDTELEDYQNEESY